MTNSKIKVVTADDHELVSVAVANAENNTDGEIVTIVSQLSDSYRETAYVWASIAAMLALASFVLFSQFYTDLFIQLTGTWNHQFSIGEYALLAGSAAILKWVAVWLILHWQPLRLLLTLPHVKRRAVHARALDLFRVGTERRTVGRTGILIYLSMLEHRAEIVADDAITAKVPAEVWGEAMLALIEHTRAGRPGEGLAEAVRQVGAVLNEHFPKSNDDRNELPDRLIEL
jgi:putative membrane protein